MRQQHFSRTNANIVRGAALVLLYACCCPLLGAAESASATVTATPPPQAAVKPLSAKQERMRHCESEAQTHHLLDAQRHAFIEACLRQKTS